MLILEFLKRIGLAILLSALVGYEREQQDKPAGLRTIMFVCVGAALSVVCAILMGNKFGINMVSIIRIPAHYLAAIGFVGSGSIILLKDRIEGITTAALLLPITVVGFLCGMGEYVFALAGGLCVYGILMIKYIKIEIKNFNINRKNKRRKKCGRCS